MSGIPFHWHLNRALVNIVQQQSALLQAHSTALTSHYISTSEHLADTGPNNAKFLKHLQEQTSHLPANIHLSPEEY